MSNLEARLNKVEAELAIRNVIALYGLAADCGDIETALRCHTDDAVYIVSNPNAGRGDESADLKLIGGEAIAAMLASDMHQSLLPNCAHTVGPLVVCVNGYSAAVTGYSRVYNKTADKPTLMRLAFNQWSMSRVGDEWKIARRESRVMGEPAAQTLLKDALSQLDHSHE
ncbi:MAG: nuclear transport factor 2 family protein [Maricaulaceae bacterium]